jgi:hypothetical protein
MVRGKTEIVLSKLPGLLVRNKKTREQYFSRSTLPEK